MKTQVVYHLFVPQHSNPDESGNVSDLSHLMEPVYKELDKAGFTGRTVHADREGHWTSDEGNTYRDKMTVIDIIADDSPENDSKIRMIAGAIARAANQESVFAYKTPVVGMLSASGKQSDLDLGAEKPPEAPESDSEGDAGLFL